MQPSEPVNQSGTAVANAEQGGFGVQGGSEGYAHSPAGPLAPHPASSDTDWSHTATQAMASGQWHNAWSALLDATLPAPLAVQQRVLQSLDQWDALPATTPLPQRQQVLEASLSALQAAHASAPPSAPAASAVYRAMGTGLVKRYASGSFTLGPVDVQVQPGCILGLVGENGNGKTTLLRLLAGDLAPNAGQLDWGSPQTDPYRLRTQLAYIPQRPHQWGGRLMDHLQCAARSHGLCGAENRSLVELVIARLSLRAFRGHQWKQLSSGYKMRFELARALLTRPRVLLLDEPLANLDINAQQTLLSDLQSLARSPWNPIAMVLSSQQLYEVEKVADSVLFLEQGQPRSLHERFAQMAGCAIEFETPWPAQALAAWLRQLPEHTHQLSGHTHIVSFSADFQATQFLRQAVDAQVPLGYFRDITGSTRRLFVKD